MPKDRASARWSRRKGRHDGPTKKTGFVTGNPRYSGKRGACIDDRPHRNRYSSDREW